MKGVSFVFLCTLLLSSCGYQSQTRTESSTPSPTTEPQPPYELKIWDKVRLEDGVFHELEIKTDGVYLDGEQKVATKFDEVWPISDTVDYWDYPEAFYKQSSTGHYYLFGTHTVNGVCGMSNYAIVNIQSSGVIRASSESPNDCMGDDPSKIQFSLEYAGGNCHPTWKLSNRLEFDAFTFEWKAPKESIPNLSGRK